MTYTGRNLLASRTEADGAPEEATEYFEYDLLGRQVTHTDFNGEDWETMYPTCCGRTKVTVDPLGHGTITHTDAVGNVTHQIYVADVSTHMDLHDPTDAKTLQEVTTKYDARRRPVKRTVWLVARDVIDPANPPIAGENGIIASDGLTTSWTYDDDLDDSTGLDSTFSSLITGLGLGANTDGSAVLITNPAGERTLSISDGLGRSLRTVQLATNNTALTQVTQGYDAIVNISGYGDVLETTSTNLLSHLTKRRTDAAGRTLQAIDAAGYISTFEYDANGNRTKSRDPNSIGEDCTYDQLNRKLTCTDTSGDVTSTTYDLAGNVKTSVDAKNKTTTYVYDARDANLSVTDRIGGVTQFTYDLNGNQLTMTDAENQTTSYEYESANRKTKETYPDHVANSTSGQTGYGIREFAYDAAGRLLRQTDQLGDTITHIYDLAGRRTNRVYRTKANSPSGTIADQDTFTFDPASRLLTAVKGRYSNTVTLTYDVAGRIATEALTIGSSTWNNSRLYDAADNIIQFTYPNGATSARGYSSRQRLASVNYDPDGTGGASPFSVATFTYDNGNRESTRTHGNGLVTTTSYITGEDLVAGMSVGGVSDLSPTYAYDANDDVTAETFTGGLSGYSFTAGYDHEARLTSWNRSNGNSQAWSLSAVGDWNTFTNNGSQQTRTHGPAHELTAIAGQALTYDPKGNLTSDSTTGHSYAWDMDNMLQTATVPVGSSAGIRGTHTYEYDALGRRAAKVVNDATDPMNVVTKRSVYVNRHDLLPPLETLGGQVLAEYEGPNAASLFIARTYTYGEYVDEPLALHTSSLTHYYHHNRVFNVLGLTTSAGTTAELYTYTPYGETTVRDPGTYAARSTSSMGNTVVFTGRSLDHCSSLAYFRDRYLASNLGRFASRDPLWYVDGGNLFNAYFVPNNLDPTGDGISSIDGAIEACMKMPTLAQRIACFENLVGNLKDSGGASQKALTNCQTIVNNLKALQTHIQKLQAAIQRLRQLQSQLLKATGKNRQRILKEIDDLINGKNGIKGHLKEMAQKWGKDWVDECPIPTECIKYWDGL